MDAILAKMKLEFQSQSALLSKDKVETVSSMPTLRKSVGPSLKSDGPKNPAH